MNQANIVIITPSHACDFERCKLLSLSVNYFVNPEIEHYIIVPAKDITLFNKIKTHKTHIIAEESILPNWLIQIPSINTVLFSLKSFPIRKWLLQQIIKIIACRYLAKDVAVFVDSDVVFVRPLNLNSFVIKDRKVRLFKDCEGNEEQRKIQYKWHVSAAKLLGLSNKTTAIPDYIGQVISWKHKHVIQMCNHIEAINNCSWITALANTWNISEYTLYGIFVDQVMEEKSEHYHDSFQISHDYWLDKPLSKIELDNFISSIKPQHKTLMISSKARISVSSYYCLLQEYFDGF